jgi:excisionase family DNA binding protein
VRQETSPVKHLLTIEDAAQILNVSTKTVRRLIKAGDLPFVRIANKSIRIHSNDLEWYIRARRTQ